MKKRFLLAIAFFGLSLGLPGSGFAADCSGELEEVSYAITDPDNVYNPGEQINTSLSFKISGDEKTEAQKLTTVLVMDVSGSMSNQDKEKAEKALEEAVDVLADNAASSGIDHEVGLVYFDDIVYKKSFSGSYLTSDYGAVYSAIETLSETGGGNTTIGGALVAAADIINGEGDGDSKKTIVLASDGKHNRNPSVNTGIASVNSSTSVYTVGIDVTTASKNELTDIAERSGTGEGEYLAVNNVAQLKNTFKDIIEKIIEFEAKDTKLSFYREDLINLGYRSANPPPISQKDENPIVWDLGDLNSGVENNISISFDAISPSDSILINTNNLGLNYESAQGENCTIETSIPQVEVIIVENPKLDFYATDLSGAVITEINSGEKFQLHWDPENVSSCQAWNNAGNSDWDYSKADTKPDPSGGNREVEASTPPEFQEYYLECWNDYGASIKKQVDMKVIPCHTTYADLSCVYGSVDCSSHPCGVSVEKPWIKCSKVKTISCNGVIDSQHPVLYDKSHCENVFGMTDASCTETEQCPECKDVDSWIEVSP